VIGNENFRDQLLIQRSIEDEIFNNEGEVTDEGLTRLKLYLESIPQKVENLIAFLDECEARGEVWSVKAKSLADKAKAFKNSHARCLEYVKTSMLEAAREEIMGVDFKFSLEGGSSSVEVFDASKVPEDYMVISQSLDKIKILKDLKLGVIIPGVGIKEGYKLIIRQAEKKKRKRVSNEVPK
jgi:hypothetical protein